MGPGDHAGELLRGDDVWSGVGLVRVLPVRRNEARGGQGTIRGDFCGVRHMNALDMSHLAEIHCHLIRCFIQYHLRNRLQEPLLCLRPGAYA